jgi:hypothetical protein
MLSTKKLRADPRNHCVPIIEVIDDPDEDLLSYMVMPFLRIADSPPFQYVKEIVDFVDQILEVGSVYLRSIPLIWTYRDWLSFTRGRLPTGSNVFACISSSYLRIDSDCVMRNLLMDADAMYPEGFHPIKPTFKRDYSGRATYIPRSVAGVRYYFADFGLSVHIPEEEPQKLVTGDLGRDQDPPELSESVPYDPFKLDMFIIGNMLRQEIHNVIVHLLVFFQRTHQPTEVRQH